MYLPRHSDALRKRHTLYAPPRSNSSTAMVFLNRSWCCSTKFNHRDLTFCTRAIAQAMKFQSVGVQNSRGFMFAEDRGSRAPIA